jgi:hypothetical protein
MVPLVKGELTAAMSCQQRQEASYQPRQQHINLQDRLIGLDRKSPSALDLRLPSQEVLVSHEVHPPPVGLVR